MNCGCRPSPHAPGLVAPAQLPMRGHDRRAPTHTRPRSMITAEVKVPKDIWPHPRRAHAESGAQLRRSRPRSHAERHDLRGQPTASRSRRPRAERIFASPASAGSAGRDQRSRVGPQHAVADGGLCPGIRTREAARDAGAWRPQVPGAILGPWRFPQTGEISRAGGFKSPSDTPGSPSDLRICHWLGFWRSQVQAVSAGQGHGGSRWAQIAEW
jgi:hypothetical protein